MSAWTDLGLAVVAGLTGGLYLTTQAWVRRVDRRLERIERHIGLDGNSDPD
jgi:hypothetical protein